MDTNNNNKVPDFLDFLSYVANRKISNDQIEVFYQAGKVFNNMLAGFSKTGMPDDIAYDLAKSMIISLVLSSLRGEIKNDE